MIFKRFVVHEKVSLLECDVCHCMIADDQFAKDKHRKWHEKLNSNITMAGLGLPIR